MGLISHGTKHTDNFNVGAKKFLRKEALAHANGRRVLDLFAGNNVLWGGVDLDRYYGIEVQKGKGRNLYADNLKVIPSLDLSGFDLIDVDTYGNPIPQIDALIKNGTMNDGTVIVYTLIYNPISCLNNVLASYFGLKGMVSKCPTLFNGKAGELFDGWLYDVGVREARELRLDDYGTGFKKRYGYFIYREKNI